MYKATLFSFNDVCVQILSKALLDCYRGAADNGMKLSLEVFQAGRNRLENEGAIALAEVFEVCVFIRILLVVTEDCQGFWYL